ncbi:MAG: SCO family protein, partial [Nitrospiria bacterium]
EGEERSGSSGENHLLGEGDRAPDFILTDQNHNQVSLGDFKGRPRFVVFIYTHCEDVCPVVIENRKRLERDLAPSIGGGIIFLAVTIDPERDTPEVLKRFVKKIGVETKDLYLLGGNPRDVEKVLLDYNISVFRNRHTGHVVGHSSVGFAIDGEGVIRETLQFSI